MKIKKTNQKNSSKQLHVVAAVIENKQGQILIAKRPDHAHQGGLWEFPGGKVETFESNLTALKRELFEELGIHIQQWQPLIQISHDYPDKSIFLDVWRVTDFDGEAHGKEGQPIQWVLKNDLNTFDFPAANKAIINAATLPKHYLITPEPDFNQRTEFLNHIENRLQNGISLIQLRAKSLNPDQLNTLYQEIQTINQNYHATILLNSSLEFAQNVGADGVHLSAAELMRTASLPKNLLCAASCHTHEEIAAATKLGIDFVVVSPVLKTASHPGSPALHWEKFESLCKFSAIPVYALGGMQDEHLNKALDCGAQGIAAIRSLWQHG